MAATWRDSECWSFPVFNRVFLYHLGTQVLWRGMVWALGILHYIQPGNLLEVSACVKPQTVIFAQKPLESLPIP